jgi:hypothetical protein
VSSTRDAIQTVLPSDEPFSFKPAKAAEDRAVRRPPSKGPWMRVPRDQSE